MSEKEVKPCDLKQLPIHVYPHVLTFPTSITNEQGNEDRQQELIFSSRVKEDITITVSSSYTSAFELLTSEPTITLKQYIPCKNVLIIPSDYGGVTVDVDVDFVVSSSVWKYDYSFNLKGQATFKPSMVLNPDLVYLNKDKYHGSELVSVTECEQKGFENCGLHKLGEGKYGSVFKGKVYGKDAALKFLFSFTDDDLLNTQREIDALKKLNCPFCVEFMGILQGRSYFAVALEFAPHGSLDIVIRNMFEAMTPKFRVRVLLDISRGLTYMHARDLMHRDIKTQNVLMFYLDERDIPMTIPIAKLTDFGTSRKVSIEDLLSMTTGTGTSLYMAPEVGRSGLGYSFPADIFSFGRVIKEIWSKSSVSREFIKRVPDNVIQSGEQAVQNYALKLAQEGVEMSFDPIVTPPDGIEDLYIRCTSLDPKSRPDAKTVTQTLEKIYTMMI